MRSSGWQNHFTFLLRSLLYLLVAGLNSEVVNSVENGQGLAKRALSTSSGSSAPQSDADNIHSSIFPALTNAPVGNTSHTITDADPNADLYAALIDTFEKLGLVTPQQRTCYTVKKIIREVFSESLQGQRRTLGIYLYVEESVLPKDPVYRSGDSRVNGESTKPAGGSERPSSDGQPEPGCQSAPVIVITGAESVRNGSVLAMGDDQNGAPVNSTGGLISAQAVDDDHAGLSRTQVMVISTCSAVIGTFFLVAAIMRISGLFARNYVKRMRESRGTATTNHRSQFRNFTGGLRGSASPLRGGNTRTSSLTGSPERQFSSVRSSKDSVLYNRAGGDRSSDPLISIVTTGDKPVLVITSASTSNSPSSSGRGSQEEISNNIARKTGDPDSGEEADDDTQDVENRPLLGNQDKPTLANDVERSAFPLVDIVPVLEEWQKRSVCEVPGGCLMTDGPSGELEAVVVSTPDGGYIPEEDTVGGALDVLVAGGLAGLSQSDTSLHSAGNPSYAYGNQVEYVAEFDSHSHGEPHYNDDIHVHSAPVHPPRQPFVPQDSFDSLCTFSVIQSDAASNLEDQKMTPIEELPPPAPELVGDRTWGNCDNGVDGCGQVLNNQSLDFTPMSCDSLNYPPQGLSLKHGEVNGGGDSVRLNAEVGDLVDSGDLPDHFTNEALSPSGQWDERTSLL